jgi:hypothetical protein
MKAVIDRIGETFAVLVIPGEENLRFNIPVALIPTGCQEGDILTMSLERDEAATNEAQARVSLLLADLIQKQTALERVVPHPTHLYHFTPNK